MRKCAYKISPWFCDVEERQSRDRYRAVRISLVEEAHRVRYGSTLKAPKGFFFKFEIIINGLYISYLLLLHLTTYIYVICYWSTAITNI